MVKIAVWGYLLALFALNVYRAATQSFTTDEAYSYRVYVGAEPFNLLHQFDANLHFLHTLATWASVKAFGLTELTFRLPSLAGCALYLGAVNRLSSITTPVAILLLTANPLLEDHMSVGRGYGLALGFLAWAMVELLAETPRLNRLAIFLALSVAANLTFLFPAAALVAVMMWRTRSLLLPTLTGPWLVFVTLVWAIPFGRVTQGSFYFGAPNLAVSIHSLIEPVTGLSVSGTLALTGFSLLLAYSAFRTWTLRAKPDDPAFLFPATLLVTAIAVISSHVFFGFAYPFSRTGMYFLFLAPLCLVPLTKHAAAAVVLAALSLFQMTRIDPHAYFEWAFDSSSSEIVRQIAAHHRDSDGPVRIACSQPMQWALSMYRDMRGLSWLTVETDQWQDANYYVLLEGDLAKLSELQLRKLQWNTNPHVTIGAR